MGVSGCRPVRRILPQPVLRVAIRNASECVLLLTGSHRFEAFRPHRLVPLKSVDLAGCEWPQWENAAALPRRPYNRRGVAVPEFRCSSIRQLRPAVGTFTRGEPTGRAVSRHWEMNCTHFTLDASEPHVERVQAGFSRGTLRRSRKGSEWRPMTQVEHSAILRCTRYLSPCCNHDGFHSLPLITNRVHGRASLPSAPSRPS